MCSWNNPLCFFFNSLLQQTTSDLEELDKRRKEEFKQYEMEKEFEKKEHLNQLSEEDKKKEEARLEELKKKHAEHPKLNHPVRWFQELWSFIICKTWSVCGWNDVRKLDRAGTVRMWLKWCQKTKGLMFYWVKPGLSECVGKSQKTKGLMFFIVKPGLSKCGWSKKSKTIIQSMVPVSQCQLEGEGFAVISVCTQFVWYISEKFWVCGICFR